MVCIPPVYPFFNIIPYGRVEVGAREGSSKILFCLVLNLFLSPFTTHQCTNFVQKHPISLKLGAFYGNLLQIHPICAFSVRNPLIDIPKLTKKHLKRRHIYVYQVNVTPPPRGWWVLVLVLLLLLLFFYFLFFFSLGLLSGKGRTGKQCPEVILV